MGTPLVRLVVSAVLAAGLAGVVSGCSAGRITQTDKMVPAVPGANADTQDKSVSLRDVLVAYQPNGYPQGGTAALSVHIVNNRLDRPVTLTSVTFDKGGVVLVGAGAPVTGTNSSASASASPSASPSHPAGPSGSARPSGSASSSASGSASASPSPSAAATLSAISIPANSYARLTPDSGGRYLAITLTEQPLRPGESVTLTFTFDDNVSVTLRVPMGLPSVAPPRSPIKLPSSAEAA